MMAVVRPDLWLLVGLAVPVAALLASALPSVRAGMWRLLPWIPLPALAAALVALGAMAPADGGPVTLLFDPDGLAMGLVVDRPGAVLLAVAALLWVAAGLYAVPMLRASAQRGRFALFWLLTLTGSLGVFVSADLISFYLAYGLVSLAAFGLIAHDGTALARRASGLYLLLAILGEIALLLAFALLSAATESPALRIDLVVASLVGSPWQDLIMALLLIGFALKIALVPLHVWMPLAYTAAPFAAAAALSGAAVKAGVIGLIRFLPFDSGAPGWGELLIGAGLLSAFYGVAIGITQRDPKTVLAYSSISQMGLIAATAGLGLRAGEPVAALVLTLYAAHHLLAKGALFLGAGVAAAGTTRSLRAVLVPGALVGLGIAGLPLTGGAAAKLATKPLFDAAALGLIASLASAGSTILMLHFLRRVVVDAAPARAVRTTPILLLSWWAMAVAALVLPWLAVAWLGLGQSQDWLGEALAVTELWKAAWPLLLGAAVSLALWRWGERLPRVPAGDVLALTGPLTRVIAAVGAGIERLDNGLRRWPVAGSALVLIALVFGAVLWLPG